MSVLSFFNVGGRGGWRYRFWASALLAIAFQSKPYVTSPTSIHYISAMTDKNVHQIWGARFRVLSGLASELELVMLKQ